MNFFALQKASAQKVVEVKAPKVLYHWLRFESLKYMAKEYQSTGTFPLSKIKKDFLITENIPALAEKPGLYVWSNPVTGIAAAATEIYGRGEAVLKLEISSSHLSRKIKAVKITTSEPITDIEMTKKILNADLVLYQMTFPGSEKIYLQEWIILNSEIISKASADPLELKSDFEKDLKHLKDPKYRYRREALHAPLFSPADNITNYMKRVVVEYITNFLQSKNNKIPDIFLTKSLTVHHCERYYL